MIGSSMPTSTPSPTAPSLPPAFAQEMVHRGAWKAGVMGAFNVASVILAVRLTLLVAVVGAIALAYLALASTDAFRLGVLAIYALVVVVPLVWLAARQ